MIEYVNGDIFKGKDDVIVPRSKKYRLWLNRYSFSGSGRKVMHVFAEDVQVGSIPIFRFFKVGNMI